MADRRTITSPDPTDAAYMRRALELARRGLGRVHPNPMVGAVVVRDGVIVGEGHHAARGQAHAEPVALRTAGEAAHDATLYVTLEPCSHVGLTPPCVEAVIAAGVTRVVCGSIDPDPRVSGRGVERLRAAGVRVDVGVLETECRALNEPFFHHADTGRPLVTVKLAGTLDGKIADRDGSSRWITSLDARRRVHALRAEVDAVVVGRVTAEQDDPALTVRHVEGRSPARVVVDTRGRVSADLAVFTDGAAVTIHATGPAPEAPISPHWALPLDARGRVSLPALLDRGVIEGWRHVLIEGGAALVESAFAEDLVDRLWLFTAPRLLGDRDAVSWHPMLGASTLENARAFRCRRTETVGPDVLTVLERVRAPRSGAGASPVGTTERGEESTTCSPA